jgi:hypothetical protein
MRPYLPDKLRIGLMLDESVVPNWIHSILVELSASQDFEISLIIFNNGTKTKTTLAQKIRNLREYAFAAQRAAGFLRRPTARSPAPGPLAPHPARLSRRWGKVLPRGGEAVQMGNSVEQFRCILCDKCPICT